jgi:hypothetical protein
MRGAGADDGGLRTEESGGLTPSSQRMTFRLHLRPGSPLIYSGVGSNMEEVVMTAPTQGERCNSV